jgi:SP family general alpha glucoside:H+ symporter-like MFS transporter
MSSINEKDEQGSVEVSHNEVKDPVVLGNRDLMNDAFDGENQEHQEGVWASAKAHPWACFWAFIMCFTIVSELESESCARVFGGTQLTPSRLWNPLICS